MSPEGFFHGRPWDEGGLVVPQEKECSLGSELRALLQHGLQGLVAPMYPFLPQLDQPFPTWASLLDLWAKRRVNNSCPQG